MFLWHMDYFYSIFFILSYKYFTTLESEKNLKSSKLLQNKGFKVNYCNESNGEKSNNTIPHTHHQDSNLLTLFIKIRI